MAMDNPDDLIPLISAKIKALEPENASKIIEYLLLQDMSYAELFPMAFGMGPYLHLQEFCRKAKSELGHLPSKGSSLNPNARPFNINDQSLSQSSQRNQFLDFSRTPTIPLSTSSIRNNPNSNSSLFHGGSSQFPFLNNNNPFPNLQTRSFSANHDRLESEQPRFWEIAQPQQQRMFAARGSPIQGSGQFGVEGGNSYSPGRHETEDINSRKIYLTFPLESTFTAKDASTYFSKFGQVEQVWTPYQQQRMYGFVTFAKAETVRTLLARDNLHFICDSPVLVKRYKEKENILQNPGSDEREDINSRKIYLTFPPYSSFTDEDVSTYFSKFGSVVDVTIPYQKRRTFGFVTFAKAETVETILAQENPHYINPQYRRKSRVTVKPWMEKEEILQKEQQQQQDHQLEGGNYTPSSSPSGPMMFANGTQENKSIHQNQHSPSIDPLTGSPPQVMDGYSDRGEKHLQQVTTSNKERDYSQETSLENTLPDSLIGCENRQTESDTEQNKEGSPDQSA